MYLVEDLPSFGCNIEAIYIVRANFQVRKRYHCVGHSGMGKGRPIYKQQREKEGWGREGETNKMAEIYRDKD